MRKARQQHLTKQQARMKKQQLDLQRVRDIELKRNELAVAEMNVHDDLMNITTTDNDDETRVHKHKPSQRKTTTSSSSKQSAASSISQQGKPPAYKKVASLSTSPQSQSQSQSSPLHISKHKPRSKSTSPTRRSKSPTGLTQIPHSRKPKRLHPSSTNSNSSITTTIPSITTTTTNSSEQQQQEQQQEQQLIIDAQEESKYAKVVEDLKLDATCIPQVAFYSRRGFQLVQLKKLARSRPEAFHTTVPTLRRKFAFLKEQVGLSRDEITKVVAKLPRLLEYREERYLKPRLDFLLGPCGVAVLNLPKVVVRAPSVFTVDLNRTLLPRVNFLVEQLCLTDPASIGKLIVRHPQALTLSDESMAKRINFLHTQIGLSPEDAGRAVLAHPQILHYSLESMLEKVDYLHSVGFSKQQVATCIKRIPQVFSLSVHSNIAPKWHYYIEQLGGSVKSLAASPQYFTLSLQGRIVPRHTYLASVFVAKGQEPPPFINLNVMLASDKAFATKVCGTSEEEYAAFLASFSSLALAVGQTTGDSGNGGSDVAVEKEAVVVSEEQQQKKKKDLEKIAPLITKEQIIAAKLELQQQ